MPWRTCGLWCLECYDPFSIDLTQDAEYSAPRLLMQPIAANSRAISLSDLLWPDRRCKRLAARTSPEEGCCSRDYEQDATRHAALRCLLRVTPDGIRKRYSAPVSGILAPQRVSNWRIVTKL